MYTCTNRVVRETCMYSNQSLDHAMCTATELEESSTLPPAAITTLYMYIQKGSYYYIP